MARDRTVSSIDFESSRHARGLSKRELVERIGIPSICPNHNW
jgi:hypothetical protein